VKQKDIISFKVFHRWFYLSCPRPLESWWRQVLAGEEEIGERFPYWLEVWPSSILLAKFILKNPSLFKEKLCLDIGCGLGALSIALSMVGGKVISQDIEFESLIYCKKNLLQNHLPPSLCVQGDWGRPCYHTESVDIIVGADIIYEKKAHIPLARFISDLLKPHARAYIAAPHREGSFRFFREISSYNLEATQITNSKIPFNGQSPRIFLWEISKMSTSHLSGTSHNP